jgi:hypothetical protein
MRHLLLVVLLLGACADDPPHDCVCPETLQDARRAEQALNAMTAERDRLRLVAARLRRRNRPSMEPSAGLKAVVASVGRLLARYGIKGSQWEPLKNYFLMTGVQADLKASVKQQTEELDELVRRDSGSR